MLPLRGDVQPLSEIIRARRRELGLSQADVADAVGLVDRPTVTRQEVARWERGKRIPRGKTRRALAEVLDVPVRQLDLAAGRERARRAGETAAAEDAGATGDSTSSVQALREALLDSSVDGFQANERDEPSDEAGALRGDLADVMAAYQASRYSDMLDLLPGLVRRAHLAAAVHGHEPADEAHRTLALANHSAAMVLTKLGELDLAWTAADRGLAAAQRTGDEAVIASLSRSVIHTLQSHQRTAAATRLTERSADRLREHLTPTAERSVSVYGTLLLAGAMASARAGDRAAAVEYLDEADAYAAQLGRDANHLWTAFGPTNVAIHRVATCVALGDMGTAYRHAGPIEASRLPLERRVRYAFDLARVRAEHGDIDEAVATMLAAERLAPEQVHHHVISRQVIAGMRNTTDGARHAGLRPLAYRVQAAQLRAVASPV